MVNTPVQGLAWVNTKFMNRSTDWPDIEFHFISASPSSDGGRQIRKVDSASFFKFKFKNYTIYKFTSNYCMVETYTLSFIRKSLLLTLIKRFFYRCIDTVF